MSKKLEILYFRKSKHCLQCEVYEDYAEAEGRYLF